MLQAFAAVGTMEGAWFVATGAPRSFSEQQLIDCAWDQGPHGCDGGDYQPGFRCEVLGKSTVHDQD
jgi:cathepsin L